MSEQQQDQETPVTPVLTKKQAQKANATVIGMLIATGVTLLLVLVPVLLNPAPKMQIRSVDVKATALQAAGDAGYAPLAPNLPDGWSANYARWEASGSAGVPVWEVGYLTPGMEFIRLSETSAGNPTWIAQTSGDAKVAGERTAGGQTWELRDSADGKASMVLELNGLTVVLTGEADLAEFDVLAEAVVSDLSND
ncbi:DUF4245 domain-containing protein [Arthrobacter sp. APC 3897]|uniref:DUF4245 domain-containing protein n=1 Tax=Arthrobacter sp. APC 3897 TaxID=3035204 RepID=UPI0025B3AF25|nr:DUF4245 domain-containing protein [Arthrobacter sp. APC 3897]MDN3480774.1 DUF4245 domain-containing protein [Arthrobacter sp. APC 3897]